MTRSSIFLILLFCFNTILVAQRPNHTFTLNGSVNMDSGQAILMMMVDSSLYPGAQSFSESPIRHGQFKIVDSCSYAYMFMIGIKASASTQWKYLSDHFIIDTGVQHIVCNIDSLWELPKIENKSMTELTGSYASAFRGLNNEYTILDLWYDSLHSIYKTGLPEKYKAGYADQKQLLKLKWKKNLVTYSRDHPDSFVALWELVGQVGEDDYDSALDSAYNYLSPGLQTNPTGIVLKQRLHLLKLKSSGAEFPKLPLKDIQLKNTWFDGKNAGIKYTLVDFWFSHCGACISQFGDLKQIYNTYRPKGFGIVGISIDEEKYIDAWKKIIADHALPWTQLLDMDGTQARKLGIMFCPSNFLCDSTGKIIRTDLQPAQLAAFLKENLVGR